MIHAASDNGHDSKGYEKDVKSEKLEHDTSEIISKMNGISMEDSKTSELGRIITSSPLKDGKIAFIDTYEDCKQVCSQLSFSKLLALDLEGIDLGRTGEICLLQIATEDGHVYLFDICTLKGEAFQRDTLKSILEEKSIRKVIFDCRCDVDALKYQYDVSCDGMYDLQVLFVKSKASTTKFLPGLRKVLDETLTIDEKRRVDTIKTEGVDLFAPEKGGTYEVWKERPLQSSLIHYAAEDVKQLFHIYNTWKKDRRLDNSVMSITNNRIQSTIKAEGPRVKGPFRDFR